MKSHKDMMNQSALIVAALSIALLLTGCAGSSVSLDKGLSHSEVVKVDKSKDNIFIAAKEWMAKNFVDSEEAIRISNQDEGKLVGRLRTEKMSCTMFNVQYVLNWNLTIRDKKYRFQQSPLYGIAYMGAAGGKRKFKKIGSECLKDAKKVLKGFRKELKTYIKNYSQEF